MAGRIEHIEAQAFNIDAVAFHHAHGHNVRMGLLAHDCDAMGAVAQIAKPSDVVGMQMRIYRLDQIQIELADDQKITINLFQHRINDQRLAAMPASQEISVRARNAVEELAEYHRFLRYSGRLRGSGARQFVGTDLAVTTSPAEPRRACKASASSNRSDITSSPRRR